MTDNQPESKEEGGADADSRKAAERLAAAVATSNADEIREAVYDQNAALINQSMTVVIPTLKTVLATVLRSEIGQITQRLDNRDRFDLDRRTEESERRQAQEEYLYKELDKLGDGQVGILAAVEETARSLGKDIQDVADRVGTLEERTDQSDEHNKVRDTQIAALQRDSEATKRRIQVVETRMTSLEHEHRRLVSHLKISSDELKRIGEEHGGVE